MREFIGMCSPIRKVLGCEEGILSNKSKFCANLRLTMEWGDDKTINKQKKRCWANLSAKKKAQKKVVFFCQV